MFSTLQTAMALFHTPVRMCYQLFGRDFIEPLELFNSQFDILVFLRTFLTHSAE